MVKAFARQSMQTGQGNGKGRGELGEEDWQLREWCLQFRYSALIYENSINTIPNKLENATNFLRTRSSCQLEQEPFHDVGASVKWDC
jgi:hypothetical protein